MLRRHLSSDIAAGKVVLGVPPRGLHENAEPISEDALLEVMEQIDFSPMGGDTVYFGGQRIEVRVYLADRFAEPTAVASAEPVSAAVEKGGQPVERRGRRPLYDWNQFLVEACRRIVERGGLPEVQAEFEREMLRERVKAGISHAREQGKHMGRPPTARQKTELVRQLFSQGMSKSQIARQVGIGRTSVRRILTTEKI